jgi:23S rRNA pseudouridine1911/1915/1917 synthase
MSLVQVPFEVQKPQDGQRVDAYLASRLEKYSRAQIQKLIAEGKVLLRGRPAKASSRVAAGETVIVAYPRRVEPPCAHESLEILHEDGDLLAVNKPAGVLSHPSGNAVENSATSILKKQFPGRPLHILHRLDRETSGVLLFAKSPEVAARLFVQFKNRGVEKEYWTIARGRVGWRRVAVDQPLGDEGGFIKVRQKAGAGLPALTEFERLDAADAASLLRARPKTGRLHQIRAHLAHLGHPVIGDKLYTGEGEVFMKCVEKTVTQADLDALGADRQMLHARAAKVEGVEISAPLPRDFRDCLTRLGLKTP